MLLILFVEQRLNFGQAHSVVDSIAYAFDCDEQGDTGA